MTDPSRLIICEYCDSAYQRPPLEPHERAHCQRCGAVLLRHPLLNVDQLLALSVTAAMLLVFLGLSPVLSIHVQGQTNAANLIDSVWALAVGPIGLMAVAVALTIVLIPVIQVALLVWLLVYARVHRQAPGFRGCMRMLEALRPWSMQEVFLLAALVTVFKLTGRIEAMPAAGLIALAALSLLMVGVAGRDVRMLWDQLT